MNGVCGCAFPSRRASSPVFFGRPRVSRHSRLSPLPRGERSAGKRGGVRDPRGWPARPSVGRFAKASPSSFSGERRLPALHCGVLATGGPRFRERGPATPVSQLLAAGRNACERSPAIARALRDTFPRSPRRRTDRWRDFPVIDPVSSGHISALPSPLLRLHGVP